MSSQRVDISPTRKNHIPINSIPILSFYRSDRLRYFKVEISSSTLLMVEPRGKSALQRLVDVGGSELFFEEFADFSSRWPTFRKVLAAVDLTE